MVSYNKLVRDKIPEILDKKGVYYEKRIASPEEFKIELVKKLKEEIDEFSVAYDLEELADIIEVIESLNQLPEYIDVEDIRQKKRQDRGGFDKKIILKGQSD